MLDRPPTRSEQAAVRGHLRAWRAKPHVPLDLAVDALPRGQAHLAEESLRAAGLGPLWRLVGIDRTNACTHAIAWINALRTRR